MFNLSCNQTGYRGNLVRGENRKIENITEISQIYMYIIEGKSFYVMQCSSSLIITDLYANFESDLKIEILKADFEVKGSYLKILGWVIIIFLYIIGGGVLMAFKL